MYYLVKVSEVYVLKKRYIGVKRLLQYPSDTRMKSTREYYCTKSNEKGWEARSYGVTVSTLDSESSDPSSNLGRTSFFSISWPIYHWQEKYISVVLFFSHSKLFVLLLSREKKKKGFWIIQTGALPSTFFLQFSSKGNCDLERKVKAGIYFMLMRYLTVIPIKSKTVKLFSCF